MSMAMRTVSEVREIVITIKKRNIRVHVADIQESIAGIEEYTTGIDRAEFLRNQRVSP